MNNYPPPNNNVGQEFNFGSVPTYFYPPPQPMAHTPPHYATRRSTRQSSSNHPNSDGMGPSGSEYQASETSPARNDQDVPPSPTEEQPVEIVTSRRGRKVVKMSYAESDPDDGGGLFDNDDNVDEQPTRATRRSSRPTIPEDEDDDDAPVTINQRLRQRKNSFIDSDDEDTQLSQSNARYGTRSKTKKPSPPVAKAPSRSSGASSRAQRLKRRNAARGEKDEDDAYVDHPTSSGASADADGSLDEAASDLDIEPEPEPEPEQEESQDDNNGKPYAFRQRQRINYAIPPPLEELRKPPPKVNGRANGFGGRAGGRSGGFGANKRKGPGWSATGAELGRWMGITAPDDSDSDHAATRTPRKGFGGGAGLGLAGAGGAGLFGGAGDLAAGGTPSNFGKVSDKDKAILADADPLGVNVNVTFDEVGGLDEHIHSLKEMTLLPLLYPEVFQKFKVTPPRGVLFHGPPGTGKTLLARALATSCRSDGRSISFFMRKGADCLSKWVGEAERQLRLLFEEARASQPAIIFFDEIDGLAPVRSSKQDQIHASIVSTLLALMDGMDGRGQVVVIGATNRPDAVDPALRRPGRFDREFYFGLPGLEAREKILGIMTRGWTGWDVGLNEDKEKGKIGEKKIVEVEEVLGEKTSETGKEKEKEAEETMEAEESEEVKREKEKKREEAAERLRGLAKLTKGYGGADLRALCTEASLNAIQRRYPQIYQSNERLLLNTDSINVSLRDFMVAIKKIIPSSARSTSSVATPLPQQFAPLLTQTVEKVKATISRVMPVEKPLTALEEAMFEDEGGEDGALEREMLSQAMQTLRVYRPRVVIHGAIGMGQNYVGAAALHHLEGYHIQSLELGTLLSDSTRTVEAAIVQLFVEAKRHQPSVIYIPSLVGWCAAVSETSRSTVRAMLDTLAPTDPVLLLAVVDGTWLELPHDVRSWFGPTKDNRVELATPTSSQRAEFFESMIKDVQRPPNQFADGMKRKLRVLEKLPIAPPPKPREPTAAELALQEETDQKLITILKYRLGPILTELKRKFKRFTKRATEEYNFEEEFLPPPVIPEPIVPVEQPPMVNGTTETVDIVGQSPMEQDPPANGLTNGVVQHFEEVQQAQQQQIAMIQLPRLFDMDLERMHTELYKGRYLTPGDFLEDVGKMVHNAEVRAHEDLERLYKAQAMYTATEVSMQEFDQHFRIECERVAGRERQRREAAKKEREKQKAAAEAANPQPNGIRRSGRNNGQEPEMSITDPVLLERRLKRQRSNEATPEEGPSEAEKEGEANREAKRPKTMVVDDDDRDPLDVVSPAPPRVHFATEVQEQETAPASTTAASTPPPAETENAMVVDAETPSRRQAGGFDPSLLNPVTAPQDDADNNPFYHPSPVKVPPAGPSSQANGRQSPLLPFTLSNPGPASPGAPQTPTRQKSKSKSPQPPMVASPAPMVIEREPTPLPDFEVDQELVSELRRALKDDTGSMTIEELEQLRATCLGAVWRHRQEWNRTGLVKELLDTVREFLTETSHYE